MANGKPIKGYSPFLENDPRARLRNRCSDDDVMMMHSFLLGARVDAPSIASFVDVSTCDRQPSCLCPLSSRLRSICKSGAVKQDLPSSRVRDRGSSSPLVAKPGHCTIIWASYRYGDSPLFQATHPFLYTTIDLLQTAYVSSAT